MANITIRDIPDTLFQDLKKQAKKERRSVNSQIIQGLSEYIAKKKPTKYVLQEIRELRESIDTKGFNPTQEQLKALVEEGRP